MSEDTWISKVRIKEYIDAIMYEERVIDRRSRIEAGELVEHPSPLVRVTGTLYGVKITSSITNASQILDLITANSGKDLFLDEVYVKNHNGTARIIILLYVRHSRSIWRLIDQLMETKNVSRVDIFRLKRNASLLPNPLLFPARLGNQILSLIPQKVICSMDSDGASYAEELSRLIRDSVGGGNIELYLLPRLIYTLGLGVSKKEKYRDNKAFFTIGCDGRVSEGYCSFLAKLASKITGLAAKAEKYGEDSCHLVVEAS